MNMDEAIMESRTRVSRVVEKWNKEYRSRFYETLERAQDEARKAMQRVHINYENRFAEDLENEN